MKIVVNCCVRWCFVCWCLSTSLSGLRAQSTQDSLMIRCEYALAQETLHGLATEGYEMSVDMGYGALKKKWWNFLSEVSQKRIFLRKDYWLIRFYVQKPARRHHEWYAIVGRKSKTTAVIYLGGGVTGLAKQDVDKQLASLRSFLSLFEIRLSYELLEKRIHENEHFQRERSAQLALLEQRRYKIEALIGRRRMHKRVKDWQEECLRLQRKVRAHHKALAHLRTHHRELMTLAASLPKP